MSEQEEDLRSVTNGQINQAIARSSIGNRLPEIVGRLASGGEDVAGVGWAHTTLFAQMDPETLSIALEAGVQMDDGQPYHPVSFDNETTGPIVQSIVEWGNEMSDLGVAFWDVFALDIENADPVGGTPARVRFLPKWFSREPAGHAERIAFLELAGDPVDLEKVRGLIPGAA